MKKVILSQVLVVCFALSTTAQLKVASNGNVGIKVTGTPSSTLTINGPGKSISEAFILADGKAEGLAVYRSGLVNLQNNPPFHYGIVASCDIASGSLISVGLQGSAYGSGGKAVGVYGIGGNTSSGYNLGVLGGIASNALGAGICGFTNTNSQPGTMPYINGIYAGYFAGNVAVTGTINGVVISSSDIRYKQDIVELETKDSKILKNILSLNPIEYKLKQQYQEVKTNDGITKEPQLDENSQVFQKKHFGLIAQDLQKLYPDLVYEEDNGYLSINYTGLIPLLIQSIKELNAKVEYLETGLTVPGLRAATDISNTQTEQGATLYQNTPNPFSETTHIKFYIPSSVKNAYLCIYNLQGNQIKQFNIAQRGNGFQEISGREFAAGIYLYALIVDGKEMDVKRMILTE